MRQFKTFLIVVLIFFSNALLAQCPYVQAALIYGCSTPEGSNEFLVVKTGTSALSITSTSLEYIVSSVSWRVDGSTTGIWTTKSGSGIISNSAGSLTVITSGSVPAGKPWVIMPANVAANYNLAAFGSDVYVSYYDVSKAYGYANGGNFANSASGTRSFVLKSASCPDNTVTYSPSILPNSTGAGVVWNSTGVASYYGGSCSTPLPIDALKAFSGESVGMDAHIQWSYVNSKKVLAQTLQQSTEAKEFRDITTPPIVQETMDYEASVSLINGNIFRLRFASEDGSISYSKHLVLSKADIDIIPTVFPNPGNDELTLRFATINDGNVSVELYSMFGNKVYSGQNSVVSGLQNITIPVSNLSSGAYIVRISGQSNNYQLRWVKNN